MLGLDYTPQFLRDYKRLAKKRFPMDELDNIIHLVAANTDETKETLRQRHNMHSLKGNWSGSYECHVANAGDWLVIWKTGNDIAVFQRSGSHDELFK